MKENCGTNVIVIYSASHTRLAKSGHQSIVHDVTRFATDGAAANFMGEGAIDTRPETGKKILNLMEAFMKGRGWVFHCFLFSKLMVKVGIVFLRILINVHNFLAFNA